jgi:hypothetical protein
MRVFPAVSTSTFETEGLSRYYRIVMANKSNMQVK